MSEYALAVRRGPARLAGFDGDSAQVVLVLRAASTRGPRAETVLERLNALDCDFLPCEIDGGVTLVNFSSIACVEVDAPAGAEDEPGLRRAPAKPDLVSGERLAGDLVSAAQPRRARVSDVLNAAGDRFVRIASPGVERFVRRDAILRVRS